MQVWSDESGSDMLEGYEHIKQWFNWLKRHKEMHSMNVIYSVGRTNNIVMFMAWLSNVVSNPPTSDTNNDVFEWS
jgi:hypothetical protein